MIYRTKVKATDQNNFDGAGRTFFYLFQKAILERDFFCERLYFLTSVERKGALEW